MTRVTTMEVKSEATSPMISEVAKPRTGPVPVERRMKPAIRVVTWASKMVQNARSYPWSTAARAVFPLASSSRTRSLISTLASTAMPRVRTKPAMPGRVRVALNSASPARMSTPLRISATSAMSPDFR